MALTPVQLVALINANIRENNRKAITGKSMNMVLNEMVNTIDSTTSVDSNIMTDDLTATGSRNQNLGGYSMRFHNGKFILGNDLSLPYLLQINGAAAGLSGAIAVSSGAVAFNGSDTTGRGVVGTTASGVGVDAVATSTGVALRATRSSGMAGQFVGKVLVEPTDTLVDSDSAIFEVNSTTLGALNAPRVSTSQKNAIAAPATSLEVFDLDRGRKEFWDGTSWRGLVTRFISIFHGNYSTPQAGYNAHFGAMPVAPQIAVSVIQAFNITLRGSGVITGCNFTSWASNVAGSNESWELYILINNTTAYFVAAVSSIGPIRYFNNNSLNIPYSSGDVVRMYYKNPGTWSQVPTVVLGQGNLISQ